MELLQLTYFEKIAQYENVSRAAAELGMSQPALSNSLKRLESELGYELFDRAGKRLILNARGHKFLDMTSKVLSIVNQERVFDSDSEVISGVVRVGCMTPNSRLLELISEYRREHPQVTFQVLPSDNINMYAPGIFTDLAVVIRDKLPEDDENRFPLGECRVFAVMNRSHRLADREVLQLSDLDGEDMGFASQGPAMDDLYDLCVRNGIRPKVVFTGYQHIYRLEFVIASDCVTLITEREDVSLKRYPELTAVPIDVDASALDKYLVWRRDISHSPAASDFVRFLREKLA